MGELLDHHEFVDAGAERRADTVDVVAGEVDQHDVLGAVFEGGAQGGGQGFVFGGRGAAFDGAGDGVVDYALGEGVFLDEQLGAGAHNVEVGAGNVEEVGGGVDGAKVAVDVEGVESGWACDTLTGHSLDDVACYDVLLELGDVGLVACTADVGGVFLVELDRWLRWERQVFGLQDLKHARDGGAACLVGVTKGGCRRIGSRDMKVGDHHDLLEEMIQGDDGVEQAEPALGDLEHVFHVVSAGLGLEVTHAVVSNISNGAAGHGRQPQAGDLGDARLGQLIFQTRQRVGFEAMLGTRCEDLARVGADEAVAADGASCGGGLEQEGVVRLGAGRDLEVDGRGREELGRDGCAERDEVGRIGQAAGVVDDAGDVFEGRLDVGLNVC